MTRSRSRTGAVLGAFLWLVPVTAQAGEAAREPIRPLPPPAVTDPLRVELGRRLFADPILSGDGTVSCRSCHDPGRGGADAQPVAVGIGGATGTLNTPTVYNAALNLAQFWDGRARTLEEQAGGPITNPVEMAAHWPDVLARLTASPYRASFRAAFGTDPSADTVAAALAEYQRTLITTGSRFDAWLAGDAAAISPEEERGYALFKSYGCASCHQGANVGGNMFQRFGFFGDPFGDRDGERPSDAGRFAVTGRDADRRVFKVPGLRLAVLTAPYFHDGSVATLPEAVQLMGRYQLGQEIPEEDITLIVQFLATLPGPLPDAGPAGGDDP
ncbi:cytochrome-c peroxidase [Azospirillum halopraeferens]|uniref:cytochrome-c peroxidase n=1 Tax=Azospirillum halopraeferens TaxID=34010 RepID=UPI00041BBFB3|nr:cytochrome c peroxidase [Azospirillum halopraeferens]